MPDKADTSQKGKSGVLASIRASVGALSLSGEPGQHEKTWKLWKDLFVQATRLMTVNDTDKLDLLFAISRKGRAPEATPNTAQTAPLITNCISKCWTNTSRQIATTLWSCTSGSTQNGHPTCTLLTTR